MKAFSKNFSLSTKMYETADIYFRDCKNTTCILFIQYHQCMQRIYFKSILYVTIYKQGRIPTLTVTWKSIVISPLIYIKPFLPPIPS